MERFTGLKSAAAEELPARGRSWISFTSRTRPGMLSMSAAGASGKNVTSGAGVPTALTEIVTLGRTLKRQFRDILAYFDHPHTTGGPTEAINGRLEHPRRSALGLAKPHQLHHPSTPRNRRIQTSTTPPIMKSLETYPLEVQLSSHTVFQVKYNYARFTDLSKNPELIAANRIPVENI